MGTPPPFTALPSVSNVLGLPVPMPRLQPRRSLLLQGSPFSAFGGLIVLPALNVALNSHPRLVFSMP
jgi:hypothetical protein